MRLYKFRDLSTPTSEDFDRLARVLHQAAFWAAPPHTLNDPEEFVWTCDYDPTPRTPALLQAALQRTRGLTAAQAEAIAEHAIKNHRVPALAEPVFQSLIARVRADHGLVCFGDSGRNLCLWERYGGDGAGVCIEVDVADSLLGTQVHRVQYEEMKVMPLDDLLAAASEADARRRVYVRALLTKPNFWAPEQEIRFVSTTQNVAIQLAGARITSVELGNKLRADVRARVVAIARDVYPPLDVHSSAA